MPFLKIAILFIILAWMIYPAIAQQPENLKIYRLKKILNFHSDMQSNNREEILFKKVVTILLHELYQANSLV
jgi:hypothetical protein